MQRLIQFYREIFYDNHYWFNISLTWFGVAAGIGLIYYFINPNLMEFINQTFQERFGENPALDINLALQIFQQNIIASGVALFGGIILGLAPLLVIIVNGFLLGYIVSAIFSNTNFLNGLIFLIAGLIPHGILELPAFLIAAALGLRIGWEWLAKESTDKRWPVLKNNFKQAFIVAPGIVVILFIAALVEVYISGYIVDKL